jgi:hypothetical protein
MAYTCEKGFGAIENVPSMNIWSISAAQAPNDSRPNIIILRKYKHIYIYCLSENITGAFVHDHQMEENQPIKSFLQVRLCAGTICIHRE